MSGYERANGAVVLWLVLGLTGCGGGGGGGASDPDDTTPPIDTFTVGGSITGNAASVTLSLNGSEETFSGSSFTFTNTLALNDVYGVAFVSTPGSEICVVENGAGIITANVTNVAVTCADAPSALRYDDAEVVGSLAVGDYNGDGNSDLAVAIRTLPGHATGADHPMTRFVFGTGEGGFSGFTDVANQNWQANKRGWHTLDLNLNNDGIDDFAYSNAVLQTYTGHASNAPQPMYNSPEAADAPLRKLDINNDGYDDIVSAVGGGSNQNQFALYRNNADGTFATVAYFANFAFDSALTAFNAREVLNFTVGEFNGDTHDDILALVRSHDLNLVLALYPGNAAGGFDLPSAVYNLPDDLFLGETVHDIVAKELAWGDFDGDGDPDIAITSTTTYLLVMLNDGTGSFSEGQSVLVGTKPIHVGVADFNRDGHLDLVSGNDTSNTVVISYGNGDGTFGDSTGATSGWMEIQLDGTVDLYDMLVANIDGDGYPDLVIAENGAHPSYAGRGSVQIIRSPGM